MPKAYVLLAAVILAPLPSMAQRLDGCSENLTAFPAAELRDTHLRDSGYLLNRSSLLAAIADPRPDLRSLAADRLGSIGGKGDLAVVLQA